MVSYSPLTLAERYLDEFDTQLPGVREGQVESVHQARVATRRLREVLPLTPSTHSQQLEQMIRTAGRALGRVRELDAMFDMLTLLEQRVPATAAAAAVARRTLALKQQRTRRRMIKRLEALSLERLHEMAPPPAPWSAIRERYMRTRAWADPLRRRVLERARTLDDTIDAATGIYFPRRVHRVRVAVKKLRYGVEIAHETGLWTHTALWRDLKRAQNVLGHLHDLQVLLDRIDDLMPDERLHRELSMLKDALRAEISDSHANYLGKRDRLRAAVRACSHFARAHRRRADSMWRRSRPLIAASAVLVPTIVVLIGTREKPALAEVVRTA